MYVSVCMCSIMIHIISERPIPAIIFMVAIGMVVLHARLGIEMIIPRGGHLTTNLLTQKRSLNTFVTLVIILWKCGSANIGCQNPHLPTNICFHTNRSHEWSLSRLNRA